MKTNPRKTDAELAAEAWGADLPIGTLLPADSTGAAINDALEIEIARLRSSAFLAQREDDRRKAGAK